tara:strand:- start:153680 stop:154393 length:714 start_codon:yes stop_codon:yes gene_type:complete
VIHILNRHCKFSTISQHKQRPVGFSREKCHWNLLNTLKGYEGQYELHYLFDGDPTDHFLEGLAPLVQLSAGSGAASFVKSIDYALEVAEDEDIIYFLEDDYMHAPGWLPLLQEGCDISDNSYVSLYDHQDKYYRARLKSGKSTDPQYQKYRSEVTVTKSCHWRSAVSTTDTLAVKAKHLREHKYTFVLFSTMGHISEDHKRGLKLGEEGLKLWTSIPGYSTHMEPTYMSPVRDWEQV